MGMVRISGNVIETLAPFRKINHHKNQILKDIF